MKVLIADLFSQKIVEDLKKNNFQIVYNDKLNNEQFKQEIATFNPDVVVVRSKKVAAEHLKASANLKAVIRAGSGYDTIDVKTASALGISVSNVPGKNSVAVCELVWGLILGIDRRIPENVQLLKEKKWEKGMFSQSLGLKGRSLGIIGFGNIGSEVAQRALAFDMCVIAFDVFYLPEYYNTYKEKKNFRFAKNMDDLITNSDIVTIHVPSLPSTKGMINKTFLSKMKKNGVLINTSRGDLAVEAEIETHLNENKDFWYGADVFQKEPAEKKTTYDCKLAQHPRVYGTHHIGASTVQSENSIGERTYEMLLEYVKTKTMPHCVNLGTIKPKHTIRLKYKPSANFYARLYAVLGSANVNVYKSNFENFEGGAVGVGQLQVETALNQNQGQQLSSELKSKVSDIIDVNIQ